MKRTIFLIFLVIGFLLTACEFGRPTETPDVGLANPASVYCEENGGGLDIRQDEVGNEFGVCIFPDGSECDEWAFFGGECAPGGAETPAAATQVEATLAPPTEYPTPIPIDPADYQGWWTYTNSEYGFSLLLPEDWVVEEVTTGDVLMNGHLLNIYPRDDGSLLNIRMTFRYVGDDFLIWPTGVGQGEFVEQGALEIAGEEAQRKLLVCPTGEIDSVWYQGVDEPNIRRGDVEFAFIFGDTRGHCEAGYSLDGKNQHVGEMIIASLRVP